MRAVFTSIISDSYTNNFNTNNPNTNVLTAHTILNGSINLISRSVYSVTFSSSCISSLYFR
jgi:hypothetical protein